MYAWLWHRLPGPVAVRALCALGLLVVAVLLLFTVVFPRLEPLLPVGNVTVHPAGTSTPSAPPP